MTVKPKPKASKGKVIFGAIAFIIAIIVIALFIGAWVWRDEHTNEMIKKGCSPASWDGYGVPTLWRCPPGVT